MRGRNLLAGVLLLAASNAGCDDGMPTSPSSEAIVTFAVVDEIFRVRLTTPDQIAAAHAAERGAAAQIPNGWIVAGEQVNTGWSWHLEDVEFAEITAEVCDGRPSDVEREGTSFDGGRFCPWSARIIRIQER